MDLYHLIHIQYCYDYLINQIPFGLLLYSHIPTALIALVFGLYVLLKVRTLPSLNLFVVCFAFAAWSISDLISWFAFLGSPEMMFAWGLLDLFAVVMFCFGYYFFYSFLTKQDLPLWQKAVGIFLLLPTAYITLLGQNLLNFDATVCEATESSLGAIFLYLEQGFILLCILALGAILYKKAKEVQRKREVLLTTVGLVFFLGFFLTANLAVVFLVNYEIGEYAYNYAIYGLFGMPVFLAYLGYLIVRYKAFDLKIFGAQALVLALLALVASQYAFISSFSNRILVAFTLVITAIAGTILIRSVRREIEQREHIEVLAKELEKSNQQQAILIRFITHQLKGFMTKSRNIFAMIKEGDYGPVPDAMHTVLDEGFRSGTKGAQTIDEILNASNIKSGKVTYAKESVDLKALTESIVSDLRAAADAKGIGLNLTTEGTDFTIQGDRMQLTNAFKNLIDNAVKYTQEGTATVTLARTGDCIRLTVQDTGVGITPEDMKLLFTEGGHGKESRKINVESTGFGLYIVKNIIEAHRGKVWAESDGAGKGSRFIAEVPVG